MKTGIGFMLAVTLILGTTAHADIVMPHQAVISGATATSLFEAIAKATGNTQKDRFGNPSTSASAAISCVQSAKDVCDISIQADKPDKISVSGLDAQLIYNKIVQTTGRSGAKVSAQATVSCARRSTEDVCHVNVAR